MSPTQDGNALAFRKLSRQVTKLSDRLKPENVHKFRTSSRRVEARLAGLITKPSGNDRKLLKLLERLRNKAGRVRDLDVQLSALRNLRIPQERARKAALINALTEERGEREARLAAAFDNATLRELSKRIHRASKQLPANRDCMQAARQQLDAIIFDQRSITEKTLHQYRIVGKRARYLAEQCPANPQARQLVSVLKRVQDAIGDWHDWLKLSEKSARFFESEPNSILLSTLRTITRNKFHEAVSTLTQARSEFLEPELSDSRKPARKAAAASQSQVGAA